MNLQQSLSILFVLTIFLFLSACQQDKLISTEEQQEDQAIIDYLTTLGLNREAIQLIPDFVLYEGDAGWQRDDLLREMATTGSQSVVADPDHPELIPLMAQQRQRGIPESFPVAAVSEWKATTIQYHIRPSVANDCGNAWVNAIREAAQAWNDLTYCRINLIENSSPNGVDILFASDEDASFPVSYQDLDNSTIARASFPIFGYPGRYVSINSSKDLLFRKKAAMMHEIGHCIGFHHTNTNSGMHIHGTPTQESNSVMNDQINNITASFKTGDIRAARLYYPVDFSTPEVLDISRFSSGSVRIRYKNNNYISKPYYWIRVYRYNTNGTLIEYQDFRSRTSNTTGIHDFNWYGLGAGNTYQFAIRGYNFRKDVNSWRTLRYEVEL